MSKTLSGREVMDILDRARNDPYPKHAMSYLSMIIMSNRSQFSSIQFFNNKLHKQNLSKSDVEDSINWIINQITQASLKKQNVLHHRQAIIIKLLNNQPDVTHNQYDAPREMRVLSKYDIKLSHDNLLARLPPYHDPLIPYLELVCGLITKYKLSSMLKKHNSYIDSLIKSLCVFIVTKHSGMTINSLLDSLSIDLRQAINTKGNLS